MRFDSYHPGICLLYFAAVFAFSIRWNQPVCSAVACIGSCICSIALGGRRARRLCSALLPCVLAWTACFAANVHFGLTRIGTWIDGNAVTLEALAAGLSQGVAIATVLMWCSCVCSVFTSDKVVYLAGRLLPKGALLLAIALRSVPAVQAQARALARARTGIGCGMGSLALRLREALRRASALLAWLTDRLVESSDSMRARGAGLRGRGAYAIYRFDNRDRALVLFVVLLVSVCASGDVLGQTRMLFDPTIVVPRIAPASCLLYAAYAALCLLPAALQLVGEAAFRRSLP